MDAENILLQVIAEYGADAQTDMMIEEMSELTKALLKHRRYPGDESTVDNIREEMADVQIMLDQMRIIYGDDSQYREQKLHRLAQRLGIAGGGNMKNAFAGKLERVKQQSYADGVWDGMQMGLDLCAIALNHRYQFGVIRLRRLEDEVQNLINEIIDTRDPDVTKAHIRTALRQIWGDRIEKGEERG